MYSYKMYGIGFQSDFQIFNLIEEQTEPEIFVRRITKGYDAKALREWKINYKILPNGVWFSNQFGQFFILDGKYIDVLPEEGVDDLTLSSFICGWCIAFVFSQRGYSAFHCTALEMKGGCTLVSGVSGAGKSTTAMRLIDRGYRYLADDIAMVNPNKDYLVEPAFPLQKMCRNVAESLDGKDLLYVDVDKDKFSRINLEDFCSEAKVLKTVILLDVGDVSKVTVEELTGINKYLKLLSGLFLSDMYVGPGLPKDEQFRVLQIAGKVKVVKITRPKDRDTVDDVCDVIERVSEE